MTMPQVLRTLALASVLTLAAEPLWAQRLDTVRVTATRIAGSVYLLQGAGGNIAVFAGTSASLLVDTQFAPLADRIGAAVADLTPAPIRYVINTHWHPDHVGSNEALARAGAVIVSQEATARRLAAAQFTEFFGRTTPAAPREAQPIVTFADSISFRIDGETITAFHVDPAHTDGDAVVRFASANVVHMGDLFSMGTIPSLTSAAGAM